MNLPALTACDSHDVTRRSFVAGAAALGACAALAFGPVCAAEATVPAATAAPADEVVVFHTNDTHGYLQGNGESVVGIDAVAALKASEPYALLVDAGDATQGLPLASLTQGSAPVELMNEAGYDAMCLGNHEFDFGPDALRANAQAAAFPLLGANVLDASSGEPLLQGVGGNGCSAVLACGGRRIGVFGLTTCATAWSVQPAYVASVEFADEVATAEAQIFALADQGVDAIVCLAHLGSGPVPCRAQDLAELLSPEAASRLTAIVDGHSHTVENTQVNGIAVVQTGCNGAAVGKLVLTFGSDGSVTAAEELLDAAAVAALVEPDPAVAAGLAAVAAEQDEILGVPVGCNPTTLWAGWIGESDISAPTRMVETNLGDLVCDAYRKAALRFMDEEGDPTPVVAVVNGGGIRAALPCGELVRGDLVTAFPFSNTVMVKLVTPAQLRNLFEAALNSCAGQDARTGMLLQEQVSGEFLQVGGVTVAADPNAAVGQRVRSLTLDGADGPLDLTDDRTAVALVSNSYVMTGGGYGPLGEVDLLAEIGGDLETIEAYVNGLVGGNGGCLAGYAGTRGRICFGCDGYEPAPWVATVRVVDADGAPVADRPVTLRIDGTDEVEAVTDADGLASVEVPDGGHGVALVVDGVETGGAEPSSAGLVAEAYVDNYMGYGLVEDGLRSWPEVRG